VAKHVVKKGSPKPLFPSGRSTHPTLDRYELRRSLCRTLDLSLRASGVLLQKDTLDSLADAAMVWIQRQSGIGEED